MSNRKRGSALTEMSHTLFGVVREHYFNPGMNREVSIGINIERNLTELALNRFKWSNLPESVDPRLIEIQLFYHGLCVFYFDNEYDALVAVRGSGTGWMNFTDNPVSFQIIGPGTPTKIEGDTVPGPYYSKTLAAYQPVSQHSIDADKRKQKAVGVWNNMLRTGDIDTVRLYATRLSVLDRTIEINTKNARRNKILKGTQASQLSRVNFARGMDAGEELLQVTGPMQDMEFLEALDLGITPDSYEKLALLRTRIWNDCMTLLGIDGGNQDKKERLVAAEISANNGQADSMRFVALNERRKAIEQINHCFGTNISVDFNVEVEAREQAETAAKNANNNERDDTVPGATPEDDK